MHAPLVRLNKKACRSSLAMTTTQSQALACCLCSFSRFLADCGRVQIGQVSTKEFAISVGSHSCLNADCQQALRKPSSNASTIAVQCLDPHASAPSDRLIENRELTGSPSCISSRSSSKGSSSGLIIPGSLLTCGEFDHDDRSCTFTWLAARPIPGAVVHRLETYRRPTSPMRHPTVTTGFGHGT